MSTRALGALLHSAWEFWQIGLEGLTWPHSRPEGPWKMVRDPPFLTHPAIRERKRGAARGRLIPSPLLSQQWGTVDRDGADPATNSPGGLGHLHCPPQPGTPWLMLAAEDPCRCCPCCLPGFLRGFLMVLGFLSRHREQVGVGAQEPRPCAFMSTHSPGAQLMPAHTRCGTHQLLLWELSQPC